MDAQVQKEMAQVRGSALAHELHTHDENILLRRIVNIPKGLPTADQAVLANVLKYHPAFADAGLRGFRDVMVKTQIDRDRAIEDQLPGVSTRRGHLKTVADAITAGRPVESAEDFDAAVKRIENADPGLVEIIGRDLGYVHAFTDASKRRRDEAVARYVLASTLFDNQDLAVFTRQANINEDDQRVNSPFTATVFAQRTPQGWRGEFRRAQDNVVEVVTRPTLEELEAVVSSEDYGYSKHERRIVHTAVRTLYADTAQDFISSLNLGCEYRERQDRVFKEQGETENAELLKDPELRMNPDGTPMYTMDEADRQRELEAREAAEFVDHGKQSDPAVYLLPGQSAEDSAALVEAERRMRRLRQSYNSREARQKDGRPLGYNAIAEDLVNSRGVRGGRNSRFGNEFGTADAGLRNRFSLSVNALRGQTGDIYITIDHTTAQSYGASMLSALVADHIASRRPYVRNMFQSQIRGMLETVEAIVEGKVSDAKTDEDRNRWNAFADAFVRGVKDRSRRASVSTLGKFIEAFCLYRTEVPERELMTALGDFAGELKEIASEVRRSKAFVPFCAAADFILGGSGFETSVSGRGRGLPLFYAMFAPHGAKDFRERVAESRNADYEKFAQDARQAARMAFRDAERRRRGKQVARQAEAPREAPAAPVRTVEEAVAAAPDEAFPELEIARAAVAEETGDDAVTMDEIAAMSSWLGGNTPKATEEDSGETSKEGSEESSEEDSGEDSEKWDDLDDTEGPRPGYFDVALDPPPEPYEANADGSRPTEVDYRDVKELTSDEARAFANVGKMLADVSGAGYDVNGCLAVVRRIVPGARQKDLDQIRDAYNLDQGYYGDDEWLWQQDVDDEALAQDGFENNNARNVEIITKSPVIRRMLAIMSKVSPSTGRDFQPFVEDLRSFASLAPSMFAERIAAEKEATGRSDLAEAIDYLDRLLNPRAQPYASAWVREDMFNYMLDMLAPGIADASGHVAENPKRGTIRRYIAAFLRSEGDAPAPCARAAAFLAYLAQIRNDNARRQLAQLIGSSAPSTPVRLVARRAADGSVQYVMREISQRPGTLSSEAITAQFARWAGRPASELRAAADRLEAAFTVVQDRLSRRGGRAPAAVNASRTGLFDTYAQVLAGEFGSDAPVVAAFTSLRHAIAFQAKRTNNRDVFLSKFVADGAALPYAVQDLVGMMRFVADAAGDGVVPVSLLEEASIGLFQSGAPQNRHVNFANTSLMGRGAWSLLLRGYADTKPVSVMRAEIDPSRTNKPASSLAITMAGIEPVIQQFLDRQDERGFRAVVDKWFPKYAGRPIDRLRQRLAWPDSLGTGMVAKNIVKTAYATEVLEGCRAAYEAERSGGGTGIVYVPMYSGDHSSSVIIQVPLAAEFAKAGMDYDQVAGMVCDWFGLDLFGVDAKRSAVTCLEAPGVSLVGVRRGADGEPVADEFGNPETGTCTYGVMWNSRPGANNEAMLGTIGIYGYGAGRIREMARDPDSATLKVHISATGADEAFGVMPTLTKALAVGYAPGDAERTGRFLDGSVMRPLMDHAESGVADERSSYVLADYDSVKLDTLNSKMVGVSDGNGGVIPLMKYFFDVRMRALLAAGEKVDGLSGAELDEKVGDIPFVNLAAGGEPVPMKLSQLVPDARVRAVKGLEGMYTLERSANQLMAFQVANVSHRARTEEAKTSRNYMVDALAAASTVDGIAADSPRMQRMFPGASRATGAARRLVSSWGVLAAAIAHDDRSVDNMLAQDEEWADARHRGEPVGGPVHDQYRRKAYAAWVKSQLRTLPMRDVYAPLVSNGAWVDNATGRAVSHSGSQMFNDTLQGARTIAREERSFWRATKRSAICNVNCTEPWFRYGMYIDAERLMSHADLEAYRSSAAGDRGVVETLEAVVTDIVQGGGRADETTLRLALAECLLDHHGNALSTRVYERKMRNRETGEVSMSVRRTALDVSYLDLFTFVGSADGAPRFDRAAVYTGMHDSNGDVRLYLGGTMFGLPRTPSYNGSMWLQTVRAGLPVTERLRVVRDEQGAETGQWLPGTDAMVAPDPFTLKILGCDHDGDKAHLYMLDPKATGGRLTRRNGDPYLFSEAGLDELFRDVDAIADAMEAGADAEPLLAAYRKRLVDAGVLRYEEREERQPDGTVRRVEDRLQLSPSATARLSNAWVQSLFDMNRLLPVPRGDDVPFYAGSVVDEGNRGLMSRATKATPAPSLRREGDAAGVSPETTTDPGAAWNASVLDAPGVLAPPVLDAATGRVIRNVDVAAKVQTGAMFVSDSRARFVKAAGDAHVLYALGVRLGVAARLGTPADFVDHMYHQDGMSNMSFDDMKEQVCSRLGLLPGIVDTFLYEFGVADGASLTDKKAVANVARFARRVNDPGDLYHFLYRAADPTDTTANAEFAWAKSRGDGAMQVFDGWVRTNLDERDKTTIVAAMDDRVFGFAVAAFIAVQPPERYEDAAARVVSWYRGIGEVQSAADFAGILNYSKVDPGDPYAGGEADRRLKRYVDAMYPDDGRAPVRVDRPVELRRMFWASQLLLGGPGSTIAARGVESAKKFRANVREYLKSLGDRPGGAAPTPMMSLVVAAHNSPRVDVRANRMQAAGNAYMVGPAAAQFVNTRQVEGSPFNGGDFFQKCAAIAEAAAAVRHSAGENGYANATMDFRYVVESMADIFARLLSPSKAGGAIPIYNYLAEYPDAGPYAYSPKTFGPAAAGAARITLGLGDVTADQLVRVQGYWKDIVEKRALDSDILADAGLLLTRAGQPWNVNGRTATLEFSVANLKVLERYLQNQRGSYAGETPADGTEDDPVRRALTEGRSRSVLVDVRMLIKVFEALEKNKAMFPGGVHIQPSALFGQLLPAYAAITDCSEEAPGPGSRSLLALVPDAYRTQQEEVRRMLADPGTAKALALAEAINWAPVQAYTEAEYEDDHAELDDKAKPSRSSQAGVIMDRMKAGSAVKRVTNEETGEESNIVYVKTADRGVRPLFVSGHRTLGVFDGTRGVAFSSLLNCIKYGPSMRYQFGVARRPAQQAPAQQAPAQQAPAQQAPAKNGRPGSGFTLHSGGAIGSDHMWGYVGFAYGVRVNHYQKDKTPYGNVTITEEQYQEGLQKVREAVGPLGRRIPSDPYERGLLARNWQQVKNADAIFAVAEYFEGVHVHGGTGWAVQMAKGTGKPIHVFNQSDKTWYRWTGSSWAPEPMPVLTRNFAGVGTRKMNSAGAQAIRDIYEATFGPLVDDQTRVNIARSLGEMFRAWNGAKVEYDAKTGAFSILANLRTKGQSADEMLFKTRINVFLTRTGGIMDSDVDSRMDDYNYMKSVFARTGVTSQQFNRMTLDERRALVRRTRPVGVTSLRFDDTPGSFRMSTGDLEAMTAKVTLDVDAKPVSTGTAFHEAFHAVMGFVRATGVLSRQDIAVLQKKYGRALVNGQEWFNEEPAAMDYQKILSAELAPSPETRTPQGIWSKLKAFFSMLLDSIRAAFSGGHRSEDYGNDMRSNPLMQIMLTGTAESSLPGEAAPRTETMDGRGAAMRAAENLLATGGAEDLSEDARREVAGLDMQKLVAKMESQPQAPWVREVMERFGPRTADGAPVDPASTDPVDTTPNPVAESSVADVLPEEGFGLPIDLGGVEKVSEDQFASEEQFDVQLVLPRIRQALPGVENNRMAVPYSDHELLAATLGAAIRDGFAQEDLDSIARLSPEGQARYEQDQVARMRLAIGKIADVFGVKVPADREALLFRGLCQLGVNLLNDGQCAKSPEVNLHPKGKPVERPNKAPTASHVTSTQLAATMAVASGVLPSDIVESALYDLRAMADRRGRGNSFVDDVLDGKLIPMFETLQRQSDDPTGLLARFEETGDSPNELMSSLLSGLVAEKDADGNRTSFRLSDGSSDNTHQEANIPLYADHVDDPDFQRAIGRAADALYMLAASRNLYRDLGFTPGRPSDAAAFPGYDGTAKSPLEMAADLGSTPEQHVDPAFEAVGFFDQTWFSAMNPKMWLDSMLAESFGKVNVRDSMRGLHAEVAGYQNRIVSLRNLHAYEYGLSDRAGTGLLEVDADYDSGFKWEGQRIVHGERERPEGVRRYKNESKTRTKHSLTLSEQRVIDLVLKARRAWLAGGRKVITGVDGLTFSLDDSADPSHYTREKVMQRVGRGYGHGETDIDKALRRLDLQLRDDPRNGDFDWIVDGAYGLRERLVKGVCDALAEARRRVQAGTMERSEVNDFVIRRLDRQGLVCGVQQRRRNTPGDRFVSAAVALDADRIEELFLKSSAYDKLLKAGRRPEWLTREAYAAPYRELWREVKSFVAAHPFLSEGDGRFFHSVNSPVPFVRGSGVFMHEAARVEHQPSAETANEVRTRYFETFERILADPAIASTKASAADADTLLMMRTMFHLPEQDVESIRRAVAKGNYADVRGLELAADGTVADVADAVYRRLVDMVWDRSVDTSSETALQFGGVRSVADLVERYRDRQLEDTSLVSGGSAGMSDEMVYRMTGVLPANHQLGHALQNAIDGVLNSFAYRAAVINMATAPAEDGTPLCFVKPAEDAAETSGVPDDIWGAVARWQASLYGLEYNPAESGVENARRIYDAITEGKEFDKKLYGSINPEEMDTRAIAGFWARKGVPEGESSLGELAGGFALGYAKHLFQSTKALGGKYQRAVIHRAWAYAKAMNVSFSLFFPIATRFESPIGAVGALATIGGNISSDLVRKYGAELQKVWKALRGKGWITKDFIGETDFARMLDSNDPFLAEMYQYATAVGLTMTSTSANVIEHSRGILLEDLRKTVEYVHRRFGAKAAKKVDDIVKFMFVRGGEKAFTYHLNATKLAVAAQMCMKLQAEAARRGVMFDPVRDLRRYSSYINAEIGGVDPMRYAWMHPKMQSLMSTVFFSWNWTRGAWEAGGGELIEKVLFGGHDVTPEETKYLIGRALRMWGWVAFGLPQLAQIVANGLALALNPDDDDRVIRDMKWFIWQHEDKAAWKSCDLEPLMHAIGRKFPRFAAFRKNHPVAGATPALVFMLTRNPWLTFASGATVGVPVETEPDKPHRHTYFHLAKQAWEFNNWFDDAPKAFFSKLAMPIQRLAEGVLGRSLTSLDYKQPWADMGAMERWVTFSRDSALFNMLRAFVPFSVSGATDVGTSGLLPVVGPTSKGVSKFSLVKELEEEIEAWASDDRRGYAFGGPVRRSAGTRPGQAVARRNVNVRRLLETAAANGYAKDRMDQYRIADAAIRNVANRERKRLLGMVPDSPDGEIDARAWGRSLRKLQRTGALGKDLREGFVRELRKTKRWHELTEEQRREILRVMRAAQTNPYGTGRPAADY